MDVLAMLYDGLKRAEPNVLGNRHAIIEINGDEYIIIERQASSLHNGANSWGRITFRKNGKVIAKRELTEEVTQ